MTEACGEHLVNPSERNVRFWVRRAKERMDKLRKIRSAISEHFEGDAPSNAEDVLKRIYFDIIGEPRGEWFEVRSE